MARGTVNKVILIGRLGSDPDIRFSASGTQVAKFNVATDEYDPQAENKRRTEWHKVVAFGKTAELAGQYLAKGKLVYIEGSLRTSQWDDPQGNKRYMTEIVVRDLTFLGGGGSDEQGGGYGAPRESAPSYDRRPSAPSSEELPPPPPSGAPDDDIPF